MSQPTVSVIIPFYNGEQFISSALDSVFSQTFKDYEVIIVDDGSSLDSVSCLSSRKQSIRYIRQNNSGVASARNNGIQHSNGEYIAFLDQDDIWLPEKLSLQVNYLESNHEVALVHSAISFIDVDGALLPEPPWAWVKDTGSNALQELIQGNRIATSSVLARRMSIIDAGLLRQSLAPADDWDLWLRIAVKYPIGYVSQNTTFYRLHDSNESRKWLRMKQAEIAVMKSFCHENADVCERIGRIVVNMKMYELYASTARGLERMGCQSEANEYWRSAADTGHQVTMAYLGMLRCRLMPIKKHLFWYLRRLLMSCSSMLSYVVRKGKR